MVIFLGDIHGEFGVAKHLAHINPDETVFQVGDFGLGFPPVINLRTGKPFRSDPQTLPDNLVFIPGNHDNPEVCARYPNCLGYYGYRDGLFWLGGAYSIDQHLRTPGVDWWYNEELSWDQANAAIELYQTHKPAVVVTHTAPLSVVSAMFNVHDCKGATEKLLDHLFNAHQPKIWVFGHWHLNRTATLRGTTFYGLAINKAQQLNIPWTR